MKFEKYFSLNDDKNELKKMLIYFIFNFRYEI
ncbi:hypothetical protein M2373_000397 [Chryseobacterium sp. JUb7]|nr:hypothetical protein [Chryseobacterium sp. JUb7]